MTTRRARLKLMKNLIRVGLPPEVEGRLYLEWLKLHEQPVSGGVGTLRLTNR
jgi:hypothetical protein